MTRHKIKIRVADLRKRRVPHRSTLIHKDAKKYTRKGRVHNQRRKALLKEYQQMVEE